MCIFCGEFLTLSLLHHDTFFSSPTWPDKGALLDKHLSVSGAPSPSSYPKRSFWSLSLSSTFYSPLKSFALFLSFCLLFSSFDVVNHLPFLLSFTLTLLLRMSALVRKAVDMCWPGCFRWAFLCRNGEYGRHRYLYERRLPVVGVQRRMSDWSLGIGKMSARLARNIWNSC